MQCRCFFVCLFSFVFLNHLLYFNITLVICFYYLIYNLQFSDAEVQTTSIIQNSKNENNNQVWLWFSAVYSLLMVEFVPGISVTVWYYYATRWLMFAITDGCTAAR